MISLIRCIYGPGVSLTPVCVFDSDGNPADYPLVADVGEALERGLERAFLPPYYFSFSQNVSKDAKKSTQQANQEFADILQEKDSVPRLFTNTPHDIREDMNSQPCKELVQSMMENPALCSTCDLFLQVDLVDLAVAFCCDQLSVTSLEDAIEQAGGPFEVEFQSKEELAFQILCSVTKDF